MATATRLNTNAWETYLNLRKLSVGEETPAGDAEEARTLALNAGRFLGRQFEDYEKDTENGVETWIRRLS